MNNSATLSLSAVAIGWNYIEINMSLHIISVVILTSILSFITLKKRRTLQTPTEKVIPLSEKSTEMLSYSDNIADPNYVPEKLRGHKYMAKSHASRIKGLLLQKTKDFDSATTAIFIAGEELEGVKYCDIHKHFRQNQYFYYLSGVNIPGSALLYNLKNDKLTLFLPNIDEEDIMWSGEPMYPEAALKEFDVDEVLYYSEISKIVTEDLKDYTILTTDTDNVHDAAIKSRLVTGNIDLFYAMDESRLIKDWYEIETIRRACEISDNCHLAVMSSLPIELNEAHIEAEFGYHAARQGGRSLGYDPICCSGPACGTLHYIKNTEDIKGKHSTLIDAGAEWRGYTSDVTRCFPIDGRYTKEHREVYETVLDMQSQTMKGMKPGASWDDLHLLAHEILIKHFLDLGIFKKEFTAEELLKRRVSCAFYPHGLGHLIGLDVHDVAGSANYEDPDPMFSYLRIRRPLEENMVLTNEPGCYFNDYLIEHFLNKFPERAETVDKDILAKYMYVGGVRIEDDILVTKDGYENLNKVTSDPDEIERIVTKGLSKSRSDFHVLA